TKPDDDRVRFSELLLHFHYGFEEWAGILSVIFPVPDNFDIAMAHDGKTSAGAGKFERQNFHLAAIARCVSDFVSKAIQRALSGIKSGNRSAHSMTETPSPKK